MELLSQTAIPLLGVLSLILIARKNKWGFVLGLATQPFWFITSYNHQQWGVMVLSIVYTGVWIYGIYRWFEDAKKT